MNRTIYRFGLIGILGYATACGQSGLVGGEKTELKRRSESTPPNSDGTKPPAPGIVPPSTVKADPNAQVADDLFLSQWCTRAATTKPFNAQLGGLIGALCQDDRQPTELFKSTLVKSAYTGAGEPQLIEVKPAEHTSTTTTLRVAVGIKIAMDIGKHFDTVALKSKDPAEAKAASEMEGGTAETSLLRSFPEAGSEAIEGPFHVRGWTMRYKVTEPGILVPLVFEFVLRNDHFKINSGDQYLYTQYISEKVQVAEKLDIVTAGLKIGPDSYLLSVFELKVENFGQKTLATQKLATKAANLVKRMYEVSK